jgi:hypothetical protein
MDDTEPGGEIPSDLAKQSGRTPAKIFSLAVGNDFIPKSPVPDRHKPRVTRREKPGWSAELLKPMANSVLKTHSSFFIARC